MSQTNVVDIKAPNDRKVTLPPIVQSIRQQSKKQLTELLQVLFNNTDDALFELADRSQTDQHQEMYFDSMRVIRLHRESISQAFVEHYCCTFDTAYCDASIKEEGDGDGADYSLLDKEELEMSVAVSGIVSKVTSQYSLAVMHLTKRFDSLAKHQTISERTNPLGPQLLSTSFAEALGNLEVNIKIRIILMKLFERFVMEQLGPLYETANQALIEADVLPDLKGRPAKSKRSTANGTAFGHAAEQVESANGNMQGSHPIANGNGGEGLDFASVQQLLATLRGNRGTTGHNGASSQHSGINVSLPALPSNELLSVLSQLQASPEQHAIDTSIAPQIADLRSLVIAQTAADGGRKALGQADDDTVNFVGMLFDYILNDRNLAIPMKALIGRLQIPIVKLAIMDKSFFSKTTHPARALLNELSSAGIGWSSAQELKRDALYDTIESIVLQVLNEFDDNPQIFTQLLEELRKFSFKDTRRSILVEQRVRESEAGKARTNTAKLTVQNLINQKASGLRVPTEVGRFISDIWSKVLTLQCVKHGESSNEWVQGVAILDTLLWALQPLTEEQDVGERRDKAPQLLVDIGSGMADIGSTQDDIEGFCLWLSGHLRQLNEDDLAFSETDERPISVHHDEMIEDIVLTSAEFDEEEIEIEPERLQLLKTITEGTWVEITDSQSPLRCKLATITQPGNNYIFVNRRGMKVVEKNKLELVQLLSAQQLKVIDESQVFDRALQSVIGSLRKMQRDRSDD